MKYIVLLAVALLYIAPFYLAVPELLSWVWFVCGVLIGVAIMIADELVLYRFYGERTPEAMRLVTRSPLFLAIYPLLAIFAITSTAYVFGVGVVMGLGLTLIVEGFQLRNQPTAFRQRFLQHLPAELDRSTVLTLLVLEVAVFVLLSVYAWIRV